MSDVNCLSDSQVHADDFQIGLDRAPDLCWQQRFLGMLPAIRRHAAIRFRGYPAEAREELVQETIARALVGYCRLVELNKECVARSTPLAHFAVRQVRSGRLVGTPLNGKDVSSAYCQRRTGVVVESLNGDDESGKWREILVEDRHAGPADTAAVRIDFGQWLKTLPRRSRLLADRLASGEATSTAARMFGISPSRVSQLRAELRRSWLAFVGETACAER